METLELVKKIVGEIRQSSNSAVLEGIKEEAADPTRKDDNAKTTIIEGYALEFVKAEVARRLGREFIQIGNARSVSVRELAGRIDAYNE